MDQMDFEIVRHEQSMVVLEPLSFSVLRSEYRMDLAKRFESIAQDWERVDRIHEDHPRLAIEPLRGTSVGNQSASQLSQRLPLH